MKLDKMVGERFKERPSDCVIDSHAFMVRGGYMKYVANGIYSQYTVLRRITSKIENIIRREMDAFDGQEVLFPVVLPGSLWEESGRYASVGSELVRLQDRNKAPLVLGMTHEEAAVQLVREYATGYSKYPFMIYQIQTKFRDEARPRGGLIRVREFTMKDAYSFHTSQEDLEAYYKRCYDSYRKIFALAGIPEVVTVKSDSGMMGGSVSHEYMLLTPVGEDSIAICDSCNYRANMEAAECMTDPDDSGFDEALTKVATPETKTIESLCAYLGVKPEKTCKAVVYQKNMTDEYVVIFLRGDLDVNETKLTNYLGEAVHPAVITEECGLCAGFIGPHGLDTKKFTVLFDNSIKGKAGFVTGANEKDFHFKGFDPARDADGNIPYIDLAKIYDGAICPGCGKKTIKISRGIEVGNIFQLGTKYTKSMNMQYLDADGNQKYPIMGCYGIGVGRLAASVCEVRHDDFGPIWPITIAPWQVHLCCIRSDDAEAKSTADGLYAEMEKQGIEVIYDDRDVRAGVMFSDADLLGVPIRVIVSPKNLKDGVVEIVTRDKRIKSMIPKENAISEIRSLIEKLTKEIVDEAERIVSEED